MAVTLSALQSTYASFRGTDPRATPPPPLQCSAWAQALAGTGTETSTGFEEKQESTAGQRDEAPPSPRHRLRTQLGTNSRSDKHKRPVRAFLLWYYSHMKVFLTFAMCSALLCIPTRAGAVSISMKQRTCERITGQFQGQSLVRVNTRLKTRLGFSCTITVAPPKKTSPLSKLEPIEKMNDDEKRYFNATFGTISKESTEEEVIGIFGPPSRRVVIDGTGIKDNWWICVGGNNARLGVWFSSKGNAVHVVWDSMVPNNSNQFYYYQHLTEDKDDYLQEMLDLNIKAIGIDSGGPICP